MDWLIAGEQRTVKKTRWTIESSEDESGEEESQESKHVVEYQTLFDADNRTYCISLICKDPAEKISESEVQEILESFETVHR